MPLRITVIALCALLSLCTVSQAKTITLVADEWCPINCEPGGDRPGYAVELAKAIFEPAGHQVVYEVMPWSRALKSIMDGDKTAAIGASPDEATGGVYPAEPLGVMQIEFYKRKGDAWTYTGIDSLAKVHLGVINDYAYFTALDEYIKKNAGSEAVQAVSGESPLETNFKKLMGGRIDTVAETRLIGRMMIGTMGIADKVEPAGADPKKDPSYLVFSPKDPQAKELAALWDAGVKKLRDSGELTRILAKYGVEPW